MGKGIAFAGNLILDQIKFIEGYPAPHSLTTISRVERSLGGLVCNCILDMAKLAPHIPLSAIGVVGCDEGGQWILDSLSKHSAISLEGVRREGTTSFTDVMTTGDGGRTFFQYRGANALLGPEDFTYPNGLPHILHVGYILLLDRLDAPDPEYGTALARVLREAQQAGIRTSVDIVSEESERFSAIVAPALRYTDYCIINELEAGRTTGIPLRQGERLLRENLEPCLRALEKMGVGEWAVIHCPEMAAGLDMKENRLVEVSSCKLPPGFIKSSVGAGDAFAAGVLLGAYEGWPMKQAMEAATCIAACSLRGSGASDSIKLLDDVLREMTPYL